MTALAMVPPTFDPQQLRAFSEIPPYDHEVIAFRGMVLTYATDAISRDGGLIEGAFYVLENQNPVSGMSWATHDRLNREHTERGEPRTRIKVKRWVVQALRWPTMSDHWRLVTPEGFSDGPYPDWSVTWDLIGKVVGVYRPAAAAMPRREKNCARRADQHLMIDVQPGVARHQSGRDA